MSTTDRIMWVVRNRSKYLKKTKGSGYMAANKRRYVDYLFDATLFPFKSGAVQNAYKRGDRVVEVYVEIRENR